MRFLKTALFMTALFGVGVGSGYSQRVIPNDLVITLERSSCFGWCPAYVLTITADGSVKFSPKGDYALRGDGLMPSLPLTGTITEDQLSVLLAEFGGIRFHSLRSRYGRASGSSRGPSCPNYSTDSPSAKVTILSRGKRKSVSHYLGCEGAKVLDDLAALENKIDKIAGTERWTSQFGWGAGSVIDLKLKINPSKP